MIVDTSALVAIALDEPEADSLLSVFVRAESSRISVANLLETWMVIDGRRSPGASAILDSIVARIGIVVEPVTVPQGVIARDAFRSYGRGSGSTARLNFGDCFAYALARFYEEPLLYIGEDFGHTDISSAIEVNGDSAELGR